MRRTRYVWSARFAGVIVCILLLPWDAAAQSVPYDDVTPDAYYARPVTELAEAGVFDGTECGEGRFCPDRPLRRWEMAVWIVRVVDGADPAAIASSRFGDVDGALWWSAHVERMHDLGITSGCGGSDYCPDEPVTRAHMAVFFARAFDLTPGPHPGFYDVWHSHWFYDHVVAVARSGITVGCGDGGYCPYDNTTRGQMATFLHRAIHRDEIPTASCEFTDYADEVTSAVFQVHTADGIGTAFWTSTYGQGEGEAMELWDEWLTAAHVVDGHSRVTLVRDDLRIEATVVGVDRATDIALLEAVSSIPWQYGPLEFSRASWLKPGTDLYAVGYPLHEASRPAVSRGVLSRIEEAHSLARSLVAEGTLILTDVPVNPGNSGGPLLDPCGKVIGMIVAKAVSVGVEGINWAIAENTLRERYAQLQAGTIPQRNPDNDTPPLVKSDWTTFEGENFDGPYTGVLTYGEFNPGSALVIRCTNNVDLEVFITLPGSHMTGTGLIETRYRGTTYEVAPYDATPSSDNEALFIEETFVHDHLDEPPVGSHRFLINLRQAIWDQSDRLFVKLWTHPDDDDTNWEYHGQEAFGIAGYDEVVKPILSACDWP